MEDKEVMSDDNFEKKKSRIINTGSQMLMRLKNSNYITYTEEDYDKGLKTLGLPMKILLDTLECNPKILFVKLNRIKKNKCKNGLVYKTRNKSIVKFLSPREVEQKAIQDVNLACSTIHKMILASGKLITSGIEPSQTVNVMLSRSLNCKSCKSRFSNRVDLVHHIDTHHPDILLSCCNFCDRKFLSLRGLSHHVIMSHSMRWIENPNKDYVPESSESSESIQNSEIDSFKSNSNEKGLDSDTGDNVSMYSTNLMDSSQGLPGVEISEKENVKDNLSCIMMMTLNSKCFNEVSVSSESSPYSLTNTNNSNDLLKTKYQDVDSTSLFLNSERKSELNIPVISVTNNEVTETPCELEQVVILPTDQQDVQKAIIKPESEDSSKPKENLDFDFASNSFLEQDTLKECKVSDVDTKKILVSPSNEKTEISIELEYFDLCNTLLDNGQSEPKNTVKDMNPLSELNSIPNKAENDNVIESESQKKVLFTKFEEEGEMTPSSSQDDDKKINSKPKTTAQDLQGFYKKMCCKCLTVVNKIRKLLFDETYSSFKYQKCPFCQVPYAEAYLLHHVVSVHLICTQQECSARFISTGPYLRNVLSMKSKIQCLQVNCHHNSSVDSEVPEDNSNFDSKQDDSNFKDDETSKSAVDNPRDMNNDFVNNKSPAKLEECDTTENNIERNEVEENLQDLTIICSVIQKKEEEEEEEEEEEGKEEKCFEECFEEENQEVPYTDSLPVDTMTCSMEENKVSSSNDYHPQEVLPQKSYFDESSEPSFCCCVCKATFHQEQKLLGHLFHYHRFSYPFTCDVCFLCYKHMKELEAHVQVHGKYMKTEEIKSDTFDTVNEVASLEKSSLSDKSAELQFHAKEEPYYLAESTQTEDLEFVKSNSSSVQQSNVDVGTCINFNVPEEKDFLKFNFTQQVSSLPTNVSLVESTTNCNPAEIKCKLSEAPLQKEREKDFSLKKRTPNITCVEKTEYPLHILYARIRNPGVNSVKLEPGCNSTTECSNLLPAGTKAVNNYPVDSNVSPLKNTPVKRKMSSSSSSSFLMSPKKIKKDFCELPADSAGTDQLTFECKYCKKKFNFKRSYSEHMYFMHDAVLADSEVDDLLTPTSAERPNIKNTLQNVTEYNIKSCTNGDFPQSPEIRMPEEGDLDDLDYTLTASETSDKVEELKQNCDQCDERFMQVRSLYQHKYDVHGDDSFVHVCENCNEVLVTVPMVNSHLCTRVSSFSCKDCGVHLASGLALKQHNAKTHFESMGPHECPDCRKCFLTNRMLQKHKIYTCIHRHSNFVMKEEKIKTEESDGFVVAQVEEVVEKTSVNKGNSPRKKREVNSVKPMIAKKRKNDSLTCPVCKFVLQSIRRLQAHLMVNHSKVTDICLLCNKLFAFGRGIRHLLDFHIIPACDKNKEYELSWEGDPRRDVKEVIEVLGDKRLLAICRYDDYMTLSSSTLFQCRLCPSAYPAVRFYRTHYIQRHDDFCALCSQSFKGNDDFTTHVGNVHNSLKHYLWFTETIISTIMQTERSKENSSETFMQIIGRKLDENEVSAASQLLERMEDERISANYTYQDECQQDDANVKYELPASSSELLEGPQIGLSLPVIECELPLEAGEVSIVTTELPVLTNETQTESYGSDILQLPDFCMEYEITDNDTVVTQNSNYCSNEILLVENMENETRQNVDNESAESVDMSNCIFENSPSIKTDRSVVDLKENEFMTVIENSSTASSQGHIREDVLLEKSGECSSVSVGINNNVSNDKVALVVTEEDLRMYRNNLPALAENLSISCKLSVEEIFETLQAYVSLKEEL